LPNIYENMPDFKGGHRIITWASMHCLPEWQREIWASEVYKLAEEYSLYGDTYYTRKKEIGRFVELPDGTPPDWEVVTLRFKHHYDQAVDYWESPFYDQVERVVGHYMRSIAESLAADDVNSAAQFAGSAAHYLEDSGVPAHGADFGDLEFVKDYLPPPSEFVCFPLHGYTEQSPPLFLIDDYEPRLFGVTVEEAAANFVHRYAELVIYARSLLFPLAQCAYDKNDEEASRLRLKAAKMCAYVYADFMYTAGCIGKSRFEPAQVEKLSMHRLTDLWPYRMSAWAPAPYFEPGPMRLRGINLNMDRKPIPCELLLKEDHRERRERFEEALGAGAYFEYQYRLAAGVFKKFTGLVGIHARLGARRPIDIKVMADEKCVFERVAKPGEPAAKIDVAIDGCRDIKLISSGPWYTEPDGSDNHVVWALPRVSK